MVSVHRDKYVTEAGQRTCVNTIALARKKGRKKKKLRFGES